MLVLSRRRGENVCVGNDILVSVLDVQPGKVRIGISAPAHVRILRAELLDVRPEPLAGAERQEA
jgi:carbon storage regulator